MNVPVTRAADGLARRAFSVAEVVRMVEAGVISEDERLEIIGGEIVPMSPKGSRHEGIKGALNLFWGKRCPDGFVFLPETGLYLDDHTYLEPDFIVHRRGISPTNQRGPDILLAVEVADSSLDYDLNRKPLIYAQFGVHELWVIDARRRLVHTHGEPGAAGYLRSAVRDASERLMPAAAPVEFAFALDELQRL